MRIYAGQSGRWHDSAFWNHGTWDVADVQYNPVEQLYVCNSPLFQAVYTNKLRLINVYYRSGR